MNVETEPAANLRIVYTTEEILELGDRRWNAALDAVEEAAREWRAKVTANNGSPAKWPGGTSEPPSMPFRDLYAAIASLRLSHDS